MSGLRHTDRMVTIQQQARALGDPTRHRVFTYLVDADRPVGVVELTDHFGLNHNAIRQHLAKLSDAGLVVGTRVPTGGPGRPRVMYSVDPTASSRWGVTGPYERLSLMLTEIVRTGDSPEDVGRRTGAQYRSDAAVSAHDRLGELEQAIDAWLKPRRIVAARCEQLLVELQGAVPSLAMLMVANRQLKTLTEIA